MQIYGYHRTSTKEQHLDRGIQEIERYCNEHEMALTNIFTDQETGKNFNRPRYTVLVEDVLRPGDILIVTELDRLGRNKYDTMQQIQRIKNMGVRLMVLELPTTLMDLSVMDMSEKRIGTLIYDPSMGRFDIRFGIESYYGGLHCGECFDVKVKDAWIPVRIEMDEDWYLVGLPKTSLSGLTVRM